MNHVVFFLNYVVYPEYDTIPSSQVSGAFYANYNRPMSILPCFSKILESAMYRRLMDYPTKHSIRNNHQYRFTKKHSTFMAILELTNKIFDSFEKNEFTIGIFIDLKKAFDTVNHSILLDKLNLYCFQLNVVFLRVLC